MRVEFDPKDFDIELPEKDLTDKDLADFTKHFSPIAEKFQMTWRLAQSSHRPRMIILVSKYDHCLVDLLYRHQSGELACDIPLIISNHPDNQSIADFYKTAPPRCILIATRLPLNRFLKSHVANMRSITAGSVASPAHSSAGRRRMSLSMPCNSSPQECLDADPIQAA